MYVNERLDEFDESSSEASDELADTELEHDDEHDDDVDDADISSRFDSDVVDGKPLLS